MWDDYVSYQTQHTRFLQLLLFDPPISYNNCTISSPSLLPTPSKAHFFHFPQISDLCTSHAPNPISKEPQTRNHLLRRLSPPIDLHSTYQRLESPGHHLLRDESLPRVQQDAFMQAESDATGVECRVRQERFLDRVPRHTD